MSIGALNRQTKNFFFNIINFGFARWHTYEHENWDLLDAILSEFIGGSGLQGFWKNSTNYTINQRVLDPNEGGIYLALVNHTSAAEPTLFAADRAANPTYWRATAYDPENRGDWSGPGTVYSKDDFVVHLGQYAISLDDHVSGATFAGDAAHWEVLIDVSGYDADIAALVAADTALDGRLDTLEAPMPANTIKGNVTGAGAPATNVSQADMKTFVGMFPTGTKMLFQQTAAPTGWTKETVHNDKALRVVTGAVGSGGSVAFSTVFGRTATDGHALTQAQLPTTVGGHGTNGATSGANFTALTAGSGAQPLANVGGGNSHTHNIDLRVNYVDLIIAVKD